jgi:uncharacterized protein
MITISNQTARRFVLGKQGLWPGRRWRGKKGTAQAIRECEAVQLDPLNIFARSQDIVLHSRVLEYEPQYLHDVAYQDREFFDYGGWLAMYPMSELPYFSVHMHGRNHDKRVESFILSNPDLFDQVRVELKNRGPLGNRSFNGNKVGWNYRGRKDTSLALFDMWLSGELMIHHRDGFERIYDFRENIAPPEFNFMATDADAEIFFARKAVSFHGLLREAGMKNSLEYDMYRQYGRERVAQKLKSWIESGIFGQVQIEGGRDTYLVLTEDLPVLETLAKGRVPKGWNHKTSTTLDEVTFLSPLDIVSARGRAKRLFDFEYKWEVYTPAHLRRWGYYVLPVLYGDDLVSRLDLKLDRPTSTMEIKGFWNEDGAPVKTVEYANALAKGLIRFADFVGANRLAIKSIKPVGLKHAIKQVLMKESDLI